MDGRGNYADRAVSALWVIIQQFLNFCKKKCRIFQRVAEIRSTGRSVENKGLGGRCQQRKTNERDGEESNTEEQRRARCFVITLSLLQVKSHALLGALITLAQIQQRLLWQ